MLTVRRIPVLVTALLLVGALALSAMLLARAPALLAPGQQARAEQVALALAGKLGRALEAGIPPEHLTGVAEVLARTRADTTDLAWIGASLASGPAWEDGTSSGGAAEVAAATAPVRAAGRIVGRVAVRPDPHLARRILQGIAIDLAIVLLVVALAGIELGRLIPGARGFALAQAGEARLHALQRGRFAPLADPGDVPGLSATERAALRRIDAALCARRERVARLAARAAACDDRQTLAALAALRRRFRLDAGPAPAAGGGDDIRAPLFMFMLAHELSRPFLPGWAMALSEGATTLSPTLAASLPLTGFMAVVALLQLPLAARSARWGRGRTFRAGAWTGMLGYALSALATGPLVLIGAQIVAGAGFALAFVGCQGHVLDTSAGADLVRGLAVMAGAIMVAGLCGPALGGLLAGATGPRATFAVMAVTALLARAAWRIPETTPPATPATVAPASAESVLRNPLLVLLVFGCALPAKALLFATCFYLVPVEMADAGASSAGIGRMQMIHPVLSVLFIPVFSGLSRRMNRRLPFVLAGAVLAAAAIALPLGLAPDRPGFPLIGLMLGLFGLAQALSITPQGAAVGILARAVGDARSEDVAYGLFRMVERAGSALGPVLAALLLPRLGFAHSLGLLALFGLGGAFLFALGLVAFRRGPGPLAERAA
ncbi:MAG: MFS transporter [Rubellimicrobium sp.]|nr:MFS transporter [Rubellimicrobium sp.]